jgi:predicted acyltransferase
MPRRIAVDALRGFCMWNMFLSDGFVATLPRLSPSGGWASFMRQFTHPEWNGFRYADANLPAFIALLAASMVLSYENHRRHGATERAYLVKICTRFLFMLGAAVYFDYFADARLFYDLAFCILFSGLLMLHVTPRGLVVTLVALLLMQWAVMAWLPVPGFVTGDYSPEGNAETYVQSIAASAISATLGLDWIAGRIAANMVFPTKIATCIIGLILGHILVSEMSYRRQAVLIAVLGSVAMALGYIWDAWCPLNKHLWTPSFAVFAAGIIFVLLAVSIQVCEIWNCRRLVGIFSWVGRSPLLAMFWFTAVPLFHDIAERMADIVIPANSEGQPLVVNTIHLALAVPCFAISQRWLERGSRVGTSPPIAA